MSQQGWCTFKTSQFEERWEKRSEGIRKSLDVEMGAAMAEREGAAEAADPEVGVYFGCN